MALQYLAGNIILGLSTDTKPTGHTEINTIFYETNTFKLFQWNGSQWIQEELDPATWKNKTLDSEQNTFINCLVTPFAKNYKRVGIMTPAVTSAGSLYGAIGGLTTVTDPGFGIAYNDTIEGNVIHYSRTFGSFGLVSNSGGALITRREYNPKIKVKAKLGATTGRLYIGFSSATPLPSSDTVLANVDSGFIVGYSSITPNYTVFNNDGTGPMLSTSMLVAKDTNWHTFEIVMNADNIQASLDGANIVTLTVGIPALDTDLYVYIQPVA